MGKGNSYAERYRQMESSSVGRQWKAGQNPEKSSRPPRLPLVPYCINEHGSLNLCARLLKFTAYVINVIFHTLSYQLFLLFCSCFNLELGIAR